MNPEGFQRVPTNRYPRQDSNSQPLTTVSGSSFADRECSSAAKSGAASGLADEEVAKLDELAGLWPFLSGDQKSAVLKLARDSIRVKDD